MIGLKHSEDVAEEMDTSRVIRVLTLLEATSINGTAKAVLQFAYEAAKAHPGRREVELTIANFVRRDQPASGALSEAVKEAGLELRQIRERYAFDSAVLPQIRSLAQLAAADLIWSNSIKSHFLVRLSGVNRQRKWVAFHHGYTTTDFKVRCYNELDRWSLRAADRVITVCEPFADDLAKRGVGRARIRIQHMSIRPFRIDPNDCAKLRAQLSLTQEDRIVLSIGRLSREKGHVDLIRAFRRLHPSGDNLKLILVGDGPERLPLEKVSRELGLGASVIFVGQRDDAKTFYGIADAFVLPSYSEGSPNVLLEAMAARVPVVATNVGGVPELAQNGVDAILVAARDDEALAGAILKVLADAGLRESVTANALRVVIQHSPEAYYESLVGIFEETLNNTGDQITATRA